MPALAVTRAALLKEVNGHLDLGTGALISGDIGIGKSHFVREVASNRTEDHIEVLIGSPAIRAIPFAACTHLVPDRAISDPLRLLQLARKTLEERAGGRQLIIVVDDLDQIDSGTMALIHQMATRRAAAVLATVRTTEAGTPEIAALWKDDHIVRIELPPLTRAEQDGLIDSATPGDVPIPVRERIWELARGNPLYTKEILLAIETSGASESADSIDHAVLQSTRLHDRIARRLDGLSTEERKIMATIALTEPLDASVVHRLFNPEIITAVEGRDLVRTERVEDRVSYRTAHPLFGELVRRDLSAEVRAQLLAAVVTASRDTGEIDTARDFRIASWLLEAGLPIDPTLARQAALGGLRVFDAKSAVRLAAHTLSNERTHTDLVVHGTALSQTGQATEADAAFAEAEQLAASDTELASATVARAMNLIHHVGDVREGVDLLQRRAAEVVDPIARADLESLLMQGEGVGGNFARALRIGPGLAKEARGGGIPELRLLVSLSVARVVTGELNHAESEIDRGLVVAEELSDIYPIEADQMMLGRLLFLLTKPNVDACLRLMSERLMGSSGAGEAAWLYIASWVLSAAGRLDHARRAAVAGVALLESVDPIGLKTLAMGAQAMVQAQSGEIDVAEATSARALTDPRSRQPRSQMFLARAEAWAKAHRGDPRAGAEIAVHRGAILVGQSHDTWGAWVAFDAVRFGHGELALDLLQEIAAGSGDGAVKLFAAHARAQVKASSDRLVDVAQEWERSGAWAHAAEAHAHAAATSSSGTESALHRQRAMVIAEDCEGLSSPVLNDIVPPLSTRQAELARRAASGDSSQTIANELFLSRRTVDNHLGSVYSVLGVSGRAELADIFGVTQSAADVYSSVI